MNFLIINSADHSIADGPVEQLPDPMADDTYFVVAPLNFGTEMVWSPAEVGFVAAAPAQEPMPVGRFKMLLTIAERIAIRSAANTDPEVEDARDLLNGFTSGIMLSDPVLAFYLGRMVQKNLLAEARLPQILAGEVPAQA